VSPTLGGFLEIFGPVAVAFLSFGLFLGWVIWGGRLRGHARHCPARRDISDAEWDGITARMRDAGGSG
jgi:hypothetical protein